MKNSLRQSIIVMLAFGILVPMAQADSVHHHKRMKRHKHSKVVSHAKAPAHSKSLAKTSDMTPQPTMAHDEQEAKRLQFLALRIDRDTQSIPLDTHVEAVAFQYHVPLSVVEDLQKQGKGWGDVSIALSMADSLSLKDKAHYPSPADAVNRITFVRATSKDWTTTARRVGIPLHTIYVATSRGYSDVVAASRNEQASLPGSYNSGNH